MRKLFIKIEGWVKGQSLSLLKKEETLVLGIFTKAKLKLEALAAKQEVHLQSVTEELDKLVKEKAALIETQVQTSTTIAELKKFGG